MSRLTETVLGNIRTERQRQNNKFGLQHRSLDRWAVILGEEYGEACQEIDQFDCAVETDNGPEADARWLKVYKELTEVAAVAVVMMENMRRVEDIRAMYGRTIREDQVAEFAEVQEREAEARASKGRPGREDERA